MGAYLPRVMGTLNTRLAKALVDTSVPATAAAITTSVTIAA